MTNDEIKDTLLKSIDALTKEQKLSLLLTTSNAVIDAIKSLDAASLVLGHLQINGAAQELSQAADIAANAGRHMADLPNNKAFMKTMGLSEELMNSVWPAGDRTNFN